MSNTLINNIIIILLSIIIVIIVFLNRIQVGSGDSDQISRSGFTDPDPDKNETGSTTLLSINLLFFYPSTISSTLQSMINDNDQ